MNLDKFLFDNFNTKDTPIFRLYEWEKSVTIGAFQKIENLNITNPIRRITGGGVLYHGHDISYSIIFPSKILKNISIKDSYEKICRFIFKFYKDLGLNVKYAKDNKNIILNKSWLCQAGFEPYDITYNDKKLGGNAQKRTKDIIFQHGSIPISSNRYGFSLEDFGIKISNSKAKNRLALAFSNIFNVKFIK